MRPEDQDNPLDLNNLPEDHHLGRESKQVFDDSSSGSHRKKKSGAKGGKDDDDGKVYECRFCSLKFCKSQALGGHMNRHRQERETETLNKARELVFHNDTLSAPPLPHLGCCHPIPSGGYQYPAVGGNNIGGDPTLPVRYPPRMFPGSTSTTFMIPTPPAAPPRGGVQVQQPPQQQQQPPPYLYSSPPRPMSFPAATHYPHPQHNDYYVGHVLNSNGAAATPPQYGGHLNVNYGTESNNYTCVGAPVGPGGGGGRDGSMEEGLNWSRNYGGTQMPRLDPPPPINRFQHGF